MQNWVVSNNALQKKFVFNSFLSAIRFMETMALEIEKLDHHPVWKNVYNILEVELSTHSKGNIVTEKDTDLAKVFDIEYEKFCEKELNL